MNTKMDSNEMTKRMICAIESGLIHIVAHPTGRIINERNAYAIDIESVADAAYKNNVALEINAYPSRLDLNDTNIMLASKYNVMFSIGSDAHRKEHMELLRFGIGTARRGWLTGNRILNTHSVDEVLKLIKK
jgi:DNA polymerase (family 10)